MIADIQTQEVVSIAAENEVQYVFVQDAELLNVGGGLAVGTF